MNIKTIDAHTAGEPLRLIVEGFPAVEGRTMLEKREFVREHHDHLRRALMLEPRGHADMYGALLTEPVRAGSHAGVLFMHNEGYSTMCGHGIIAVVKIGIERGLFSGALGGRTYEDGDEIVLDSPAGPIRARPTIAGGRVTQVSFVSVPSFVLHAGVPVRLGARELRADVAFGGAFYAIVDSEAAGIPIARERLDELRRAGMQLKAAVERAVNVVHPHEPGLHGIYGTIFTGPPSSEVADLRNVTIFADAEVDRSPCGTGTCAVMAVLAAMGMLGPGQTFTHESIIGTVFRGRVVGEELLDASSPGRIPQDSGGLPALTAILPEISGEAYVTGESDFSLDENDPLRHGFRL